MPEENDDQLEEEMLRMMQEEGDGDSEGGGEEAAGGDDAGDAAGGLEAEMLSAMMQEAESEPEPAGLAPAMGDTPSLATSDQSPGARRMSNVRLSVTIELGHCVQPISTLLDWTEGSLIELDKVAGDAVDVLVNGKPFARGEVVTVAENFGVRLTEISRRGEQ